MANGARDENRRVVMTGSFNGTPTALKVDHATGYLKATIYHQTLAAPSVTPSVAARDGNRVQAMLGTFNGSPKSILVTNADGYVRAVLI